MVDLKQVLKFIPTKEIATTLIDFDPDNPNKMSAEKMASLEKVMIEHKFAVDLWVNYIRETKRYKMMDGEHRLKILLKHNIKKVPCKIFEVDDATFRILRIEANELKGTPSQTKLAHEYKIIFNAGRLQVLADYVADRRESFERVLQARYGMKFGKQENELPIEIQPVANLGDLFQLGDHLVLCGDALNSLDVKTLFRQKRADQLVTDPPYGVDYSEKNEFLNSLDGGHRLEKQIENDTIQNYKKFFGDFIETIPFAEFNTIYIFQGGKHLVDLHLAMIEKGITPSEFLVWLKNNHVLSRKDYNTKHEFVFYGWKGKHKFYGESNSTTILEFDKPQKSDLHPVMKPVPLLVRIIQDGSTQGMIVYDPFLGSGSTLIAAEQAGRICFGMEIDPAYVDVTIARWEKMTNQKAQLLASAMKMPV